MSSIDLTGLEPDAVRVVELIVQRLRFGQETYGPLDLRTNPRDWKAEANEEFLDGAIYMSMRSLQRPIDREIAQLKETIRELERAGDAVGARAATMKFTAKVRERAGITVQE